MGKNQPEVVGHGRVRKEKKVGEKGQQACKWHVEIKGKLQIMSKEP